MGKLRAFIFSSFMHLYCEQYSESYRSLEMFTFWTFFHAQCALEHTQHTYTDTHICINIPDTHKYTHTHTHTDYLNKSGIYIYLQNGKWAQWLIWHKCWWAYIIMYCSSCVSIVWCHHHHLWTVLLAIGLITETSCLWHICIYAPSLDTWIIKSM